MKGRLANLWPKTNNISNTYKYIKETFRLIKFSFRKTENNIEAAALNCHELDSYYLQIKTKKTDFVDMLKFSSFLSLFISSVYGLIVPIKDAENFNVLICAKILFLTVTILLIIVGKWYNKYFERAYNTSIITNIIIVFVLTYYASLTTVTLLLSILVLLLI